MVKRERLKTHYCGELRSNDIGKKVILAGWIKKIRSHGELFFMDLRDMYGVTQIVVDKELLSKVVDISNLKKESCIRVNGEVVERQSKNPEMDTGDIEIKAENIEIINLSKTLPIDKNALEDMRLKYRYIDIRTTEMIDRLYFRHKVGATIRDFLNENDFTEVTTPMLLKPTPEGARDYVVPSRVNPGEFYSLPQSPQLMKQLLMISGINRYYQFAICLRDEDLRQDRQPEHIQVDLEMNLMYSWEIREIIEDMLKDVFKKTIKEDLNKFEVLTYAESISRYGSDKPDTRFGLHIHNITECVKKSGFKIFEENKSTVAIAFEKELSKKEIKKLEKFVIENDGRGLAFVHKKENDLEDGISKFLNDDSKKAIVDEFNNIKNGTILILSGDPIIVKLMGMLRNHIGKVYELYDKSDFNFVWIIDYPLFEYNEEEKRWEAAHNPFVMPKKEFINNFDKHLKEKPGKIIADLWDLVLNGVELASGAIRNNIPEMQEKIIEFIGYDKEYAEKSFGFLLEAYKYGGPTHGGMGMGFDRLVAMMMGIHDIREVMAFPKNKNAQCPVTGAPERLEKGILDFLNIKLKE